MFGIRVLESYSKKQFLETWKGVVKAIISRLCIAYQVVTDLPVK